MNRPAHALLRSTLRARRREFVRLTGWSLVQAVPALLSGWLVARAVDNGFLADRSAVGLGWLGLLACTVLLGAWGTRQATLQLAGVVEPFRDDLVTLVATGTLHRSARRAGPTDTAGVARLTEQVEIARESYGAIVMFVQTFSVTAVSVLLGLAALDPAFLLFVLPPLAAGLALFLLALRAMAARQRAVVLADEAIAEQVGAVADGLRDVTACGAEDVVRARVGARIDAAAGAARALARLTAVRTAALGVGGWLPLVLILAGAPWLVRDGVTTGAVLGALTYVSQALQPALRGFVQGLGGSGLWLLVTVTRILEAAGPTETEAADPGDADPGNAPPATAGSGRRRAAEPGNAPPAPRDGRVELCGVTYGYARSAEPVVRDLGLVLAPGTHLAVVGPSGAGKSTLAALVAGVLEPQAGRIRLGGVPVRDLDRGRLSRSRVLIPQEAYVFSGTLRENLAYLHPTATPPDLDAAVHAIGAQALVQRLGGYDATVDPAVLSAGERQLIALVRALLPPARLVLLDEATCHLDPAAEAVAERAFTGRPATLIVCAHRISSALRADLVLVMDGSHCRLGTHDRLMADCALYRDLIGHWDERAEPARSASPEGTLEVT
ncbi:ABC transporter ATP-binding protein [Streptomyces coacervatus]|uniref:ABC transporter ATP-binding protein n=1 Tax=Streptomyces coacervatus TaxID=647381 RepID=A0ABP7H0B0_9ACTN|nr:ABC transporter ATP-binding protein [Streptomyces coacervatus]MDF2268306.1 ABC transporter ATP-binding protein [Streptomyces coacervatus]